MKRIVNIIMKIMKVKMMKKNTIMMLYVLDAVEKVIMLIRVMHQNTLEDII
uniref:Uncharacterized protein n=1 Tax=viral metagenome TaxID=1070528 RepID=A0A6C0HQ86_9ZZZZ